MRLAASPAHRQLMLRCKQLVSAELAFVSDLVVHERRRLLSALLLSRCLAILRTGHGARHAQPSVPSGPWVATAEAPVLGVTKITEPAQHQKQQQRVAATPAEHSVGGLLSAGCPVRIETAF